MRNGHSRSNKFGKPLDICMSALEGCSLQRQSGGSEKSKVREPICLFILFILRFICLF